MPDHLRDIVPGSKPDHLIKQLRIFINAFKFFGSRSVSENRDQAGGMIVSGECAKNRVLGRPQIDGVATRFVIGRDDDKGVAIGKNGRNAERIRFLAKRYFQIQNVSIT